MHRWLLAVFVALAMLVAACGGGGDDTSAGKDGTSSKDRDTEESADDDTADQAPSSGDKTGDAAATEDSGEGTAPGDGSRDDYLAAAEVQAGEGDAAEVGCLTAAYIDAVGLDRLNAVTSPQEIEEQGLPTPAELGIELTEAEGDTFYDAMSECVDVRQFFLGSWGDQAVVDCLNQKVDDAMLKAYVVALFTMASPETDDPAITALQAVMTECQQLALPTSG